MNEVTSSKISILKLIDDQAQLNQTDQCIIWRCSGVDNSKLHKCHCLTLLRGLPAKTDLPNMNLPLQLPTYTKEMTWSFWDNNSFPHARLKQALLIIKVFATQQVVRAMYVSLHTQVIAWGPKFSLTQPAFRCNLPNTFRKLWMSKLPCRSLCRVLLFMLKNTA